MTIVIVAFTDDAKHSVAYRSYTDIEEAARFYRQLLEQARFETKARKPRVISTRILLP